MPKLSSLTMGHNFTKVLLHRSWMDRNVVIGKGSPQA